MATKREVTPGRAVSLETAPRNATAGRRRRPSTKVKPPETPAERREKTKTAATGAGAKRASSVRRTSPRREDKREDPNAMVSTAEPNNIVAERNDKKRKGKSTHALEAHSPGTRPSRKSTRRSANHMKRDSQQRRRATRVVRSPKVRASSAAT